MSRLEELWTIVSSIPRGRVSGYGDVGRALSRPVSGVLVGKWMAQCPPEVPWWRVCGKSGDLLVGKRDPNFARQQAQRLTDEGVRLVDGCVEPDAFWIP